jgi:LmbE family N-acetylglucosaminyl deacetylase
VDRRAFLKTSLAAGAAAALPTALEGCATLPVKPDGSPEPVAIDGFLAQGARTMWIAPHPDDECFPGSIMARSSIRYGNPLYMLVFTHGDGGECCIPEGCHPDVKTVRGNELAAVAKMYRAELQHEYFWNAPLPVESFPKREEIFRRWQAQGDPIAIAAKAIRRFRPDLLLTFEPTHGATGHPEHQLGSRIATAAARLAADPSAGLDGLAVHRVTRTYYLVNRYWVLVMFGHGDPPPITEEFDASLPCTSLLTCQDFMNEATKLHRTQDNDMSNVRYFRAAFRRISLRQTDPWKEIYPPDELA